MENQTKHTHMKIYHLHTHPNKSADTWSQKCGQQVVKIVQSGEQARDIQCVYIMCVLVHSYELVCMYVCTCMIVYKQMCTRAPMYEYVDLLFI